MRYVFLTDPEQCNTAHRIIRENGGSMKFEAFDEQFGANHKPPTVLNKKPRYVPEDAVLYRIDNGQILRANACWISSAQTRAELLEAAGLHSAVNCSLLSQLLEEPLDMVVSLDECIVPLPLRGEPSHFDTVRRTVEESMGMRFGSADMMLALLAQHPNFYALTKIDDSVVPFGSVSRISGRVLTATRYERGIVLGSARLLEAVWDKKTLALVAYPPRS